MSMNTRFKNDHELLEYLNNDSELPQCFTVNYLPETQQYELWIGNQPYYTYEQLIELEERDKLKYKDSLKQMTKENEMNKRHLDALIAIRDYGWSFIGHGTIKVLLPPANDERINWCAMWDEFGYPHWLPKYSEGEE